MFILGIILTLLGVGSLVFGLMQNNSLEAQFTSLLSSGSVDPGTIWIIAGAIAVILGLVLIILGKRRSA